ncbi:glycerol kinase [Actinacidiphila yanglinensis]|uniref:ATP:glycerol 3-phosphotransferase n=1 Tax=Actinacidiphila yanglinensis TaxID=310779 RepID=A0A1H6DBU9_9ACTN|nr:FGGY family carbohydrate kinase [Actinacidiphila yanglinensis]SEG82175.1 glycerol kinase [Actinacidiphila yanglinensis]
MTTILAIDQGTSSTKAVVHDEEDGVVAVAEEPLRPDHLSGGRVEQDADAVLRSVLVAGRRAVTEAGRAVDAVAVANQGETVLAWDPRTGRPLTRALVWQDGRAAGICAELAEHREKVAHRTGLVLDPYFSAPKMAWIRRELTTEGVVSTLDAWLLHHLTGEFVTDAATASRSLLTDLDTAGWDEEMLGLFGLGDERLPRLVDNDAIVGTTSAFGAEIPVGGLVVDQQAALLAEGCLEPGDTKCTYGTGAFLLANTGTAPVRSAQGLTASVAWRLRGRTTYCLDGQVYTAASAVRWLQELGLIGSAAELDAVAAEDSDGVLCVPAFAGLAAPWWRSDATASVVGMTLSTRREHLVLAVLQGIAAQVCELGRLVEEGLRPAPATPAPARARARAGAARPLRVDGGLTRSGALLQAQADLLQAPVEVYPFPHATALGAAALARLALRPERELADVLPPWQPQVVHRPRWEPERAAAFRSRWQAAARATLDLGAGA